MLPSHHSIQSSSFHVIGLSAPPRLLSFFSHSVPFSIQHCLLHHERCTDFHQHPSAVTDVVWAFVLYIESSLSSSDRLLFFVITHSAHNTPSSIDYHYLHDASTEVRNMSVCLECAHLSSLLHFPNIVISSPSFSVSFIRNIIF